jgi:hypothetical protein
MRYYRQDREVEQALNRAVNKHITGNFILVAKSLQLIVITLLKLLWLIGKTLFRIIKRGYHGYSHESKRNILSETQTSAANTCSAGTQIRVGYTPPAFASGNRAIGFTSC